MMEIAQNEKRRRVHDTVSKAAIKVFAARGFDQTTVEEIAQATGISRRTFFRYFASKDDLLAQTAVSYGAALQSAIESCPAEMSPFEVIRSTVRAGVDHAAAPGAQTRQVVEIAIRSASARQAYQSRTGSIEDSLANAFAARATDTSVVYASSRMLAGITLAVMNATIASWFSGEHQDLPSAANQVLQLLATTIKGNSHKRISKRN
jgi:AcrR family transcriptional regulator